MESDNVRLQGDESDARAGRLVEGKYRLEERLGAGGMGTVYRATRLLIGDAVAVKVLHPALVSDRQAAERFRREAQAAARLKHSNAVSVYDFGVTQDGLVYLVMELVEGESLRELIRRQGPLVPAVACEIARQACAALEEAHRQGVVHRDVKPDNIVVGEARPGLRVKMLDFGIARIRDIAPAAGGLTQTGMMVGTPRYMSPEQCLGEEVDERSDIYSLGVVLYEMLCGTVPFNSPTPTAIAVQHATQAPPSLRAINMGVAPEMEAAVMRALSKRREDRPQTAAALAQELTEAESEVTLTRPTLSGAPHAYAETPGTTPTVVMNGPKWQSGPVPPPAPPAQPGQRRRLTHALILILSVLLTGATIALFYERRKDDLSTSDAGRPEATITPTRLTSSDSNQRPADPRPSAQSDRTYDRYSTTQCGSIKDGETRLEWFVGPDRNMTWEEARQWATGLRGCGGGWRMPTVDEIRSLHDPTLTAGTGFYTGGRYFPAHIHPVFNAIGGGAWVWSAERASGANARSFNLNQGKAVEYDATNTTYSTRVFAVRAVSN